MDFLPRLVCLVHTDTNYSSSNFYWLLGNYVFNEHMKDVCSPNGAVAGVRHSMLYIMTHNSTESNLRWDLSISQDIEEC